MVLWYERYGRRVENYRLPKTGAARQDLAATIGADGQQLLSAIDGATKQPKLALLPAVQVLHQVWAAQYVTEDGRMRLGVRWNCHRPPGRSAHPMTTRPATATSATRPGLVKRCR